MVNNRELQIVNPEIVNGLQTSMEIYNYFSENREALESEKRSILLRIIVPDNEESRDQIIFATKNQTNIPKATLRVTDPIHLQIEMYFKRGEKIIIKIRDISLRRLLGYLFLHNVLLQFS